VTVALAERPRAPVAAPETGATSIPSSRQVDSRQLELAARIATLLTRPIAYIDDAYCRLPPLEAAQLKAMASHPAFRASVNRAVAVNIGFATVDVDAKMVSRLAFSPWSRLAAIIATASMADVRQIAVMLAAAVLSKRIRSLVLKSDRELAHESLGPDSFAMATHEAPVLHPALHELDAMSATDPLFAGEGDPSRRRMQIVGFGCQIIGRFFDASEPFLGHLFSRRMPPGVKYAERDRSVRRLEKIHCEQFVKLIRRRQRSWSAIID
jgi:hypothetical protein